MASIRATATFIGRVQGVGFRATTTHIAQTFRVAGWVRNQPDGSVLCVVEGDEQEVQRFLTAVRSTLEHAIHSVDVQTSPATGEFTSFDIRR